MRRQLYLTKIHSISNNIFFFALTIVIHWLNGILFSSRFPFSFGCHAISYLWIYSQCLISTLNCTFIHAVERREKNLDFSLWLWVEQKFYCLNRKKSVLSSNTRIQSIYICKRVTPCSILYWIKIFTPTISLELFSSINPLSWNWRCYALDVCTTWMCSGEEKEYKEGKSQKRLKRNIEVKSVNTEIRQILFGVSKTHVCHCRTKAYLKLHVQSL